MLIVHLLNIWNLSNIIHLCLNFVTVDEIKVFLYKYQMTIKYSTTVYCEKFNLYWIKFGITCTCNNYFSIKFIDITTCRLLLCNSFRWVVKFLGLFCLFCLFFGGGGVFHNNQNRPHTLESGNPIPIESSIKMLIKLHARSNVNECHHCN